jgi:hypothetical protein
MTSKQTFHYAPGFLQCPVTKSLVVHIDSISSFTPCTTNHGECTAIVMNNKDEFNFGMSPEELSQYIYEDARRRRIVA